MGTLRLRIYVGTLRLRIYMGTLRLRIYMGALRLRIYMAGNSYRQKSLNSILKNKIMHVKNGEERRRV